MKVVVIGGGPGGFSAAMVAKRAGSEVTLIERTDALGGLGLVAGIGFFGVATTVFIEEKALGGGDLGDIFISLATHKNIKVPGVGDDVILYNVTRLDAAMQRALKQAGIDFILGKAVVDAEITGNMVKAVVLSDGSKITADAFVDSSGATEGPDACNQWGFGCIDCIYRCPFFGFPGGIVEKKEKTVSRLNAYEQPGVIGTSVLIPITSLSPAIQKQLAEKGFVLVPVPPGLKPDEVRMKKAGAPMMFRYEVHTKNIIILDIGGHVKVTALGSPMWASQLRHFPGLEDAWIAQPTAGRIGHLVTWSTMALRDNCLKADGFDNVFVAGHKAGPHVSLMDAIVTGDLAGYNAVRYSLGKQCLELPKTLMAGAFIDMVGSKMRTREGLMRGYGILEAELLEELKVFRTDKSEIVKEVEKADLKDVYQRRIK